MLLLCSVSDSFYTCSVHIASMLLQTKQKPVFCKHGGCFFKIIPTEMKIWSQWKLKIISFSTQQPIVWEVVNYCTENKIMIASIFYAEVHSGLKAPLEYTTDISKVQIHKG